MISCEHEWDLKHGMWHHNHNGGDSSENIWRQCLKCGFIEKRFPCSVDFEYPEDYNERE
jgi:hypothetical protein